MRASTNTARVLTTRNIAFLLSILWWATGAVSAQRPVTQTFEVASVRANPLRNGIRGHSFPGDRFVATNVPLRDLIAIAYGEPGHLLPDTQLTGGPSWIASERFDVTAKVSADSPSTIAQKQLLLRTLLAERFKLAVHRETRVMPRYAMVAARSDRVVGPQLRRADVDCEALLASQPGRRERCILYALPSGTLTLRGQTMSALANALSSLLGRPVVDQTGLTGGFDADAEFNPDGLPGMAVLPPDAGPSASDAPSLFTTFEEQLGLKLESGRGPVEVFVIDQADRPTEN
jgi:uncharacterized protein (TIGR03435 family)